METLSYLLAKDVWTLFTKNSDFINISIEEGSLAYWRLGTNAQTKGHSMEIGDLVTFHQDVYIKSIGNDTIISVTT